jgi:hypothetical protein
MRPGDGVTTLGECECCVIVTYRNGEKYRVFGMFPSYDDAAAWCDANRTPDWRDPVIAATRLPDVQDPSEAT